MKMPKGISGFEMLDEDCTVSKERDQKQVKLFRLDFDSSLVEGKAFEDLLPDKENTSGTFCLREECDDKYRMLVEKTRKFPEKRTFGVKKGADSSRDPYAIVSLGNKKTFTTVSGKQNTRTNYCPYNLSFIRQ